MSFIHVYFSAGHGFAKKNTLPNSTLNVQYLYFKCLFRWTNTHEGYNIFVLQLVAKGGITADVIFNYKVLPQVTTELCYKNSQVRLKNCIGVYHQWADNRLDLYVWYAWRGWCGWWVSHSDTYVCTVSSTYWCSPNISAKRNALDD